MELKEREFIEHTLDGFKERKGYLKSEADAYIADLEELHKEEVDELQKSTDSAWGKVNAMYDEILHQKRKRCLAMARWCAAECVVNQDTYKKYSTHKSEFRIVHLRKWYFRWLKIAEQFK